MKIKALIIAAAGLASVALPGAASAQNYGYGQGYYGQPRYGYDNRHDDRYDRHDRKRWEQRRRWEEKQRRHEWERAHRHGDRFERDYDRDHYRY